MRYLLSLTLLTLLLGCNRQVNRIDSAGGAAATSTVSAPAPTDRTPQDRSQQMQPEVVRETEVNPQPATMKPGEEDKKPVSASSMNPNWEKRKRAQTSREQLTAPTPDRETPPGEMAPVDARKLSAPALFQLRKTPCYGDCPVYRISVLESEVAILDAKKGTVKNGHQVRELSHFDYTDLITQFRKVAGMELADRYPEEGEMPVDLPYTELTFTDGEGKPRVIEVYGGAPEPVAEFIETLEALATGYGWK